MNGAAKIIESMRANGWAGDPIDVVRMPDGGLTTIDNRRVVAANQAGIDVQATIHGFDDPLPQEFIERFTTPRAAHRLPGVMQRSSGPVGRDSCPRGRRRL